MIDSDKNEKLMSTLNGPSRGGDIGGGCHSEPPSAAQATILGTAGLAGTHVHHAGSRKKAHRRHDERMQSSQANSGCMLSGAGRVHPVIVGWSTANRPLIAQAHQ